MSSVVIADHCDMRQIAAYILKNRAVAVAAFDHAGQAWQHLRTHPAPTLLISNWRGRGLDGFELVSLYRSRHPKAAVVLWWSMAIPEEDLLAIPGPRPETVTLPIEPNKLVELLQRLAP